MARWKTKYGNSELRSIMYTSDTLGWFQHHRMASHVDSADAADSVIGHSQRGRRSTWTWMTPRTCIVQHFDHVEDEINVSDQLASV
jgi:hypothetical protein